jgi:hypothetical protein
MASTKYQEANCDICGWHTWKADLQECFEGFVCWQCARLPACTDEIYQGLVRIQRLFRKHRAAASKPCFHCEKPTLTRYEFEGGLVCENCHYELADRRHDEHCHCDDCEHEDERDEPEPCEDCNNPYECVCAEQKADARLIRHRRICGFADCEGDCGTLDCGCIDKCKCPYDDSDCEQEEHDW